jgi:diguanylate cyclase (GGDEF)-like protein
MQRGVVRTILSFLLPGGLILFAAVGFLRPQGLPLWCLQPVAALPYFVLGFGLIFGWYFSSTRMILSLVSLALADRALALFPLSGNDPSSISRTVFSASSFLLPLNFLAFCILKEEAIGTLRGAARIIPILIQPILVLWLCYPEQEELAAALQMPYLPVVSTTWTPVPQASLLAFLVAGAMHITRFALRREPMDGGATWALAAVFLAYHGNQFAWQPTNFFSTAGLILFVTLVQSSYQRTYRDDLTGIAGRVAYDEATAQIGKQCSIAVLAIDQLKLYAGTHGKPVVEQILKLVAPKVQATCQGGQVFRVSGEELTLLFNNQSAMEVLVTLDKVRRVISSTSLFLRGRDRVWEDSRGTKSPGGKDRELPITVSIGVAEKSSHEVSLSLVLKAAYRALYEAKSAGGNVAKRGSVTSEPVRRSYGNSGRIVSSGEY